VCEQGELCEADCGKCGDVNGDSQINLADILYLVNYIFKAGPPPIGNGDVNGDDNIRLTDVILLVNYIFKAGPSPACTKQITATSNSASLQLVQSGSNINLNGNLQIPAAGLQLELAYDPNRMNISNISLTSKTGGLDLVIDKIPGRYRIALYKADGSKAIPSGFSNLLTIRFSGSPAGANLRILNGVAIDKRALEMRTRVLANKFTR